MRQTSFSRWRPLDSVSVRAQHRSCTNKMTMPRKCGWSAPPSDAGLFTMTDAVTEGGDKIRCDACPVMCYIKPGAAGACDRYANHNGELVRVDPHIVLERTVSHGGRLGPVQARGRRWGGKD